MTFILFEHFLLRWVMPHLTDIMICKECKYCTFFFLLLFASASLTSNYQTVLSRFDMAKSFFFFFFPAFITAVSGILCQQKLVFGGAVEKQL